MGVACRGPSLRPKGESGSRWAPPRCGLEKLDTYEVVADEAVAVSFSMRPSGRGAERAVRRPGGYIPWSHGPLVVTDCPEGRREAMSWQDGTSWQARKALVSRRHLPPTKRAACGAHIVEKGRGDIRRHQLPAPDSSRAGQAEAEEVTGRARRSWHPDSPPRLLVASAKRGFRRAVCICNVACGDSCVEVSFAVRPGHALGSAQIGPVRTRSHEIGNAATTSSCPFLAKGPPCPRADRDRSSQCRAPVLQGGPRDES